jgi:phosphate/sulfate permease
MRVEPTGAVIVGAVAEDQLRRPAVPAQVRLATVLVALEALALVAAAVLLLVKTVVGSPTSLAGAVLAALLALLAAAVLAGAARGLRHLRPAARTPVVVLQLLALPVAFSLTFQAGRVEYGGPVLVVALAVLFLLFTPPARLALDREPPGG